MRSARMRRPPKRSAAAKEQAQAEEVATLMEKSSPRRRALEVSATAIYAVVRAIPRGKVATYGQVAELAGIPAGHRVVARAMRDCPARLPWQRVVGRKDARRAQINIHDPEHVAAQRMLLQRDGVEFDAAGCIALARFGWLPN